MRIIPESNQLTITLEGMEQLWALKRRVEIPHYAISQIDYMPSQPTMQDLWGYWRVPGTSLPGIFLAGSYRRHGEREFWYLKMRTPGVLIIYLKPDTTPYDKLRLTCSPEVAQAVQDWWKENKDV